jgi:murein DD-endopeptidase MepM/ murein hydrolase activator NlpD
MCVECSHEPRNRASLQTAGRWMEIGGLAVLSAAEAATSASTVKADDTIYGIARARKINMVAPEAVNPELDLGRALQVRQVISLPTVQDQGRRPQTVTVRTASIRVSWRLPVQGRLTTSCYGTPDHAGIDIAAPLGTPIVVSQPGLVTESHFDARTGWGWTVVIDFGSGIRARYSHNEANLVRVGDTVQAGQIIARLGSTGKAHTSTIGSPSAATRSTSSCCSKAGRT